MMMPLYDVQPKTEVCFCTPILGITCYSHVSPFMGKTGKVSTRSISEPGDYVT